MSTVQEYWSALACVKEGGVIAMAEYDNGHGNVVYKVCFTESMITDLLTSPYVDQATVKFHYRNGKWKIPPKGYD